MTATMIKPKTYTVKEAASTLGLSVAIVRLRCQEGACPADYHEFPGTARGFYLLNQKSLDWLKENVRPHQKPDDDRQDDSPSHILKGKQKVAK